MNSKDMNQLKQNYMNEKSESNNEYNISNYDWFNVVLAAYPVLIEYGK